MNTYTNEKEQACQYQKLKAQCEALDTVNLMISEHVVFLLNQIIRNIFVPKLREMLWENKLELVEPTSESEWVQSSYAGFQIINTEWKNFCIGIEFENRWLKKPIIGFLKKNHVNRKDCEEMWKLMQEKYGARGRNNDSWIYKSFIGEDDWHTDKAIEKIVNGDMVSKFEKMIKELLKVAEEIKNEGYEL